MVLQQFGGVNGIAYYASAIFESAGKLLTQAIVPARKSSSCRLRIQSPVDDAFLDKVYSL